MAADYEFGAAPAPTAVEIDEAAAVNFDGVQVLPSGRIVADAEEPELSSTTPPEHGAPAWEKPLPAGLPAKRGLDALFADLERDLALDPVDLPVPARDGFACRYERLLDTRRLDPWRAAAFDRSTLEGIDQTRLASLGLSQLHVGFVVDGQLVPGDDGAPLTFRSPGLQCKLGITPPGKDATDEDLVEAAADAVLRYYALMVHAKSAWQTLLAMSGFADEITPQERPSPT